MKLNKALGTGLAGKQIKRDHLITFLLLIIIIGGVCFFWTYLRQTSPLEIIKTAVMPVTQQAKWVATIYGDGNVYLTQPRTVYVHKDRIYVSDTGNHRIVIFDYNGRYISKFGDSGDEKERLIFPYGMAVVNSRD
ncbi:6-bladed beta-propeller [Phosphitispora sp. TUW77]|uniref:6-bladed beta-propeller n=1 Tax=Phosphitispora sp. TUW77 TaxID=3152361 RepID=UPI003AB39869